MKDTGFIASASFASIGDFPYLGDLRQRDRGLKGGLSEKGLTILEMGVPAHTRKLCTQLAASGEYSPQSVLRRANTGVATIDWLPELEWCELAY